jgi:hypothetical protein
MNFCQCHFRKTQNSVEKLVKFSKHIIMNLPRDLTSSMQHNSQILLYTLQEKL